MNSKTTDKLIPKDDKWTELELKSLSLKDDGKSIYESSGSLRGKVSATQKSDDNFRVSIWFRYRYKFQGQQKDLALGTWPKISLKKIRSLANQARAMLDDNRDPAVEKKLAKLVHKVEQTNKLAELEKQRTEQLATENRITVQTLFERWEKLELVNRKDSGKEVRRMFEKDVLPTIGSMAVEDVRKGHIAAILDAMLARGIKRMVKLVLALMRQMFRFAQDRDIIENDPTSSIRKAKVGGKDVVRDRHLSESEIRSLTAKIPDGRLVKSTECAIWIILSTCCRIGELCKAQWSHVDLEAGEWKIPAENSKNGKPHTIYLSPFATHYFKQLTELKTSKKWVYPNTDDTDHVCIKSITKQVGDRQLPADRERMSGRSKHGEALILSGGKWTPHDLRRTGATIMGNLGIRPDVIEKCLNHIEENKMIKTYQHQSLKEEQALAWKQLGERLEILTSDETLNVVSINSVKAA